MGEWAVLSLELPTRIPYTNSMKIKEIDSLVVLIAVLSVIGLTCISLLVYLGIYIYNY